MHHLFTGLPVEQLGRGALRPGGQRAAGPAGGGGRAAVGARRAGVPAGQHRRLCGRRITPPCWRPPRIDAERKPVLVIDIGTNTEISLAAGGRSVLLLVRLGTGVRGRPHPRRDARRPRRGGRRADNRNRRWHRGAGEHHRRRPPSASAGRASCRRWRSCCAPGWWMSAARYPAGKPPSRQRQGAASSCWSRQQQPGTGGISSSPARISTRSSLPRAPSAPGSRCCCAEAGMTAEAGGALDHRRGVWHLPGPQRALRIGMFPQQPLERFHQVGNAAGRAPARCCSRPLRTLSAELAARSLCVDLTTRPGFMEVYVGALGM